MVGVSVKLRRTVYLIALLLLLVAPLTSAFLVSYALATASYASLVYQARDPSSAALSGLGLYLIAITVAWVSLATGGAVWVFL